MENENIEELEEVIPEVEPKKRNGFGKRIFSIALMCVLIVSAVLITLSAVVTKNYNFNFDDPTLIKIHTDSSSVNNGLTFSKNDNEYKKILSLYNNSFKTKVITALFQGKLGNGVTVKEGYKSFGNLTGTYLEFFYNDEQTLYVNGEKYEANIVSDESYFVIAIEVANSSNLTEINAYFKYRSSNSNDYSYVRLVSYAVQADLYDYIENL